MWDLECVFNRCIDKGSGIAILSFFIQTRAANGGAVAYIYPDAESLVGNERVDDGAGYYPGQCVSLVKKYTHAAPTLQWKEGARVKGNYTLRIGTAIADIY